MAATQGAAPPCLRRRKPGLPQPAHQVPAVGRRRPRGRWPGRVGRPGRRSGRPGRPVVGCRAARRTVQLVVGLVADQAGPAPAPPGPHRRVDQDGHAARRRWPVRCSGLCDSASAPPRDGLRRPERGPARARAADAPKPGRRRPGDAQRQNAHRVQIAVSSSISCSRVGWSPPRTHSMTNSLVAPTSAREPVVDVAAGVARSVPPTGPPPVRSGR